MCIQYADKEIHTLTDRYSMLRATAKEIKLECTALSAEAINQYSREKF